MKKILKSLRSRYLCFVVILAILISMITYCGFAEKLIVYADEGASVNEVTLPDKKETDKYTDSDYLYDGTYNSSYTIQQYDDILWGTKVGMDDAIVQIVPRGYFYSECSTTVIGKEYGFYVLTQSTKIHNESTGTITDGFMSDIFIFDISITANSTGNEFYYTVAPLYTFNYYSDHSGIRPKTLVKPDLSSKYFLHNVSFGFTVFNENNFNLQDSYGYQKEKDKGPIILQTRYNSNGFDANNSMDVDDAYIAIKKIGTSLPVVGEYIEIATNVIDYVSDANSMADLLVWQETELANNNENNIVTYPDKSTYGTYDPYIRTGVIFASDDIVYKAGKNHYAQGVLLLGSLEGGYRLYENINLEIVTMNALGGTTIVSTGKRCEYSIHNIERETISVETNTIAYTLPYGEKRFKFTPLYNGYYNLIHNTNGNYSYYFYKANASKDSISSLTNIFLEKGVEYCIDIVNNNNEVVADIFYVSMSSLIKDQRQQISLNSNATIAYKYVCTQSEILDIVSSDSNLVIKNIFDVGNLSDNDSDNVNQSHVSKKFFSAHIYIIEFENISDQVINTNVIIQDVSNIVSQFNPNSAERYFCFINNSSATGYIFSFLYSESNLGIDIVGNDLQPIAFEQGFGIGYKTVKLELKQGEKIYISIKDISNINENVTISYSIVANAYKWKVNDAYIIGNSIELAQGKSATLELIINDSVSVKTFQIANADYKFSTSDNTITIAQNCRISNYFEVKAVRNSTTEIGFVDEEGDEFYTYSLYITPILSSNYTFTTFSDNTGYGIKWSNSNITRIEYQVNAGIISEPFQDDHGNIMELLTELNYSGLEANISILRIQVKGEAQSNTVYDWVYNNTKGLSVSTKYVNTLYYAGNGTSSSPFLISCGRHLDNIRLNTTSEFKLIKDVACLENWKPIDRFDGVLNMGSYAISFTNTSIETEGNYGFIDQNYGNIYSGDFYPYFVTKDGGSTTVYNLGVVCAVNYGTIDRCFIKHTSSLSTDIYIKEWHFYFGGIAGSNYGTIKSCVNYSVIRGNCVNFGGIVGWNGGADNYMYSCTNRGDIYAETRGTMSAGVGGVVGLAGEGSKIEQPYNAGDLLFDFNNSNYNVTVYMGQIAGRMCEVDTLIDPYCGGSAAIASGVYVNTSYVSNGAVGMYFASSKVEEEESCIAAGTLITLADGRQVPVETLTGNEMLLVWNLHTGSFDVAPILFIDHDAAAMYKIINLQFSDGTQVKVIYEHAFWDFNLNKYVFLREDAAQYVGHWFNKQTTDANGNMIWTRVQLMNVTITEEYTTAWSPVTYGHLCIYVNGMLSMPGATEGLINIFEVDGDTMQIDQEQYLADIATYGLFTYEEFAEIYPIPETIFEAFGGEYLKVSIGKGLIDYETLGELIERYSEFFE